MKTLGGIATFVCLVSLGLMGSPAARGDDGGGWDAYVHHHHVFVHGQVTVASDVHGGPGGPGVSPYANYQWLLACMQNQPGAASANCANAHTCPRANDSLWVLWAQRRPGQNWIPLTTLCRSNKPPVPSKPVLTPGQVLEAVRRMGLPSLQLHAQPDNATLVNFATIFYTEPPSFTRSVSLLGYDVDVRASVVTYRWVFGDGEELSTTEPGAPYPAKDITHEYAHAHVTMHPRVDVSYAVQYRVDGGDWQSLDQQLTAPGPPAALRIKEATPVLSGGAA